MKYVKGKDNVFADWLSRREQSDPASGRSTGNSVWGMLADGDVKEECVPLPERRAVFYKYHNEGGHCGIKETIRRIPNPWRGVEKDVTKWVRECRCQLFTGQRALSKKEKLTFDVGSLYEATNVFDTCAMDVLRVTMKVPGTSGMDEGEVLCIVDVHSKRIWTYLLENKESSEIWEKLQEFFDSYPTPVRMLCDNGTEFLGDVERGLEENNVTLMRTGIYSPQSNGICERTHQEVLKQLRIIVDASGESWKDHLQEATDKVNSIRSSRSEMFHDQVGFGAGEIVWVWKKPSSKLSRRWRGPARILEVKSGGDSFLVFNYEDSKEMLVRRWHVKKCQRTFDKDLRVTPESWEALIEAMGIQSTVRMWYRV